MTHAYKQTMIYSDDWDRLIIYCMCQCLNAQFCKTTKTSANQGCKTWWAGCNDVAELTLNHSHHVGPMYSLAANDIPFSWEILISLIVKWTCWEKVKYMTDILLCGEHHQLNTESSPIILQLDGHQTETDKISKCLCYSCHRFHSKTSFSWNWWHATSRNLEHFERTFGVWPDYHITDNLFKVGVDARNFEFCQRMAM